MQTRLLVCDRSLDPDAVPFRNAGEAIQRDELHCELFEGDRLTLLAVAAGG